MKLLTIFFATAAALFVFGNALARAEPATLANADTIAGNVIAAQTATRLEVPQRW